MFENNFVLKQIHSNGIIESAKIYKTGYPSRMTYLKFIQNYGLLYPVSFETCRKEDELKEGVQSILNYLKINNEMYKFGVTKIFFKTDVLDQIDEKREVKKLKCLAMFQAQIKTYLLIRNFKLMIERKKIGNLIRRNVRKYLEIKSWKWWKLMKQRKLLAEIKERVNCLIFKFKSKLNMIF